MKVTPSNPTLPNTNANPTQTAQDKRERAIQALMGNKANAQTEAVQNPTKVAPEELAAIAPKKEESEAQVESTETKPDETRQANTTEEVKPAAEEESPQLSQQYAVLARKEKALRAKFQAQASEMKAKEDAMAAREAALKAKEASYQTDYIPKSRLTEDPYSTLQDVGVSYDRLTEIALQQSNQDPAVRQAIQRLEAKYDAELKAIKDGRDADRKAYEDNQKKSYDQALNQIRNDTKSLVNQNEAYETIKATDSINDVVELIEQTFQKDGTLLTVDEACQAVEDYLVEEALKLTKLKKIQNKLQAPGTKTVTFKEPEANKTPAQPQMKTLTNSLTTTKPLSARERAIAAMNGERK